MNDVPAGDPVKILYCIDSLVRGGTELQLTGLIDRLDRSRFDPHLLTIRPTASELVPRDCTHLAWSVPRLVSPGGAAALWRLARFMRREGIGIVQTFFQDSTLLGGAAARMAGVPVRLASFRDLGFWRTPSQSLALRRIYATMTGFLCNAGVVKDHVVDCHGLDPDDVTVIPNGVDVDSLPWVDHPGPTLHVGIVGNLDRRVKRADLFIAAAARAARAAGSAHPPVTWHIIGDGRYRAEYEAQAEREGFSDRVVFCGRIADVAGYLEKLQVGVLCSDSEGFSNALLEYLFKGCAAIATDVGGNAEVIEDGRTGLLVPPDDVGALAAAMTRLLEDPDLRRDLARRARARVEAEYDWRRCVSRHEAFYGAAGTGGVRRADS